MVHNRCSQRVRIFAGTLNAPTRQERRRGGADRAARLRRVVQDCELSPTYQVSTYTKDELLGMLPEQLAPLVSPVFPWGSVDLAPIQLHALVLSMFASIIAPFGVCPLPTAVAVRRLLPATRSLGACVFAGMSPGWVLDER